MFHINAASALPAAGDGPSLSGDWDNVDDMQGDLEKRCSSALGRCLKAAAEYGSQPIKERAQIKKCYEVFAKCLGEIPRPQPDPVYDPKPAPRLDYWVQLCMEELVIGGLTNAVTELCLRLTPPSVAPGNPANLQDVDITDLGQWEEALCKMPMPIGVGPKMSGILNKMCARRLIPPLISAPIGR